MNLFENRRQRLRRIFGFLTPFVLILSVCLLFYAGISAAGTASLQKEQAALEQAVVRGAVHTYSLTGRYPESLSQLTEACRITYDPDRFLVEYVPSGSNRMPFIQVIPLRTGKGDPS